MNSLQRFVWGHKSHTKNIQPLGNDVYLNVFNDGAEFCLYEGAQSYYHKGNTLLNHEQNKYKIVKVNIRRPELRGTGDGSVYSENNVYVFVECQNDSGNTELYRFYIGKKLGEFYLELPRMIKVNKIYSVVGMVNLSIVTAYSGMPGYGCAVYATDALAAYELVAYKIVNYPLTQEGYAVVTASKDYAYDLWMDKTETLHVTLNAEKTKYITTASVFLSCGDINPYTVEPDEYMKINLLGNILANGIANMVLPEESLRGFDTICFKKVDGSGWSEFPIHNGGGFAFRNSLQRGVHYIAVNSSGFQDDGYGNYHAEFEFQNLEFKLLNKVLGTSTLPLNIQNISYQGSCYISNNHY